VYTLKKDKTILERLGTITLLGMFQAILKIGTCTGFFYLISLFGSLEECILLAVSLFATDNFHTLNIIQEGFLSR
jgi:NhaP-type Na+/H+ or K+/H+ antiporter